MPGGNWILVLVVLMAICALPRSASAEDEFLWKSPESGTFTLSPEVGWSTSNQMDGIIVGLSGLFVFDHFLGGLHGQAIFVDTGAMYTFGLDFQGRYGPIYLGTGPYGHYFPSRTGAPIWGISFQAGVHLPTPLEGVFLDLSYRPAVFLSKSKTGGYHTFLLGVLFET
jgi:hypothetical protein